MRRTTLSLIFALVSIFCLYSMGYSGFSLGINPVRWEASGNPGSTLRRKVTMTGGRGTVQLVTVEVGDWTLTEGGAPVFGKGGTMAESAASWVRYDPKKVKLYPRQTKAIRVSIKIPEDTPSGSYRTALFFKSPDPDEKPRAGSASVFLRGQLALLIYVTVGDARPNAEIIDARWRPVIEGGKPVPALKVQNRGNAHLRMNGIFTGHGRSGKRFEGIIQGLPILAGQTRWVSLEFRGERPEPHSDLDLVLRVDLGQGARKISVRINGKA